MTLKQWDTEDDTLERYATFLAGRRGWRRERLGMNDVNRWLVHCGFNPMEPMPEKRKPHWFILHEWKFEDSEAEDRTELEYVTIASMITPDPLAATHPLARYDNYLTWRKGWKYFGLKQATFYVEKLGGEVRF